VIFGVLGAAAGMLTASVIDVAGLSYESVPARDGSASATRTRPPSRSAWSLAPSAHVGQRGDVMVGAVGTF
jgi:hypothetical protein